MATWINEDKLNGSSGTTYLLKEDTGFLLLEDGGKIILNEGNNNTVWSNQIKS